MNERFEEQIFELAKQAGMLRDKFGLYWNAHDNPDDGVDLEKFAELIVKECLRIVAENTYGPYGEYDYSYTNEKAAADDRANAIYADITERFGVK